MAESTSLQKRRTPFRIRIEPHLSEPPVWYPARL
jgi:hypothetical protein